jgi:hypothetical protein
LLITLLFISNYLDLFFKIVVLLVVLSSFLSFPALVPQEKMPVGASMEVTSHLMATAELRDVVATMKIMALLRKSVFVVHFLLLRNE